MIYLDNGATTFIKPNEVIKAIEDSMLRCSSVGRSGYESANLAGQQVFECRDKIATLFNVSNVENIIFTHNATYALNMAIKGYLKNKKGVVSVSGYEHNSVMRPLKSLEQNAIRTKIARGLLFDQSDNIKAFKKAITKHTRLVILNHVSNVFGFIQPIYEIDQICHNAGIPLILDVSQSAGIINIDISRFKSVIALCMPGHKALFGPQGTGILIITGKMPISTIIEGGTGSASSDLIQPEFLPDRYESGTLNAHGISGLCKGIEFIEQYGIEKIHKYEYELISYLASELKRFDDTKVFFCPDENVQSGVMSIVNRDIKCEVLAEVLSQYGVCTRAGLHCSPNAHKSAMTYTTGTLRISVSVFNTLDEMDEFIKIYRKII